MSYHVLVMGKYQVAALEALREDFTAHCEVYSFLKCCFDDKNFNANARGIWALINRYAEHGPRGLTSDMMHEANKNDAIQELIKGRIRVLGFIENGTLYLTNGYIKKSQAADKQEVARAVRARSDFLQLLNKKGSK